MSVKKLLLVEDDLSLGATLQERLAKEGYSVAWARSLAEARREFAATPSHLVILDVGLPDGSGFEFAREIRAHSKVPFLFVTAQNTAEDRLQGYEIGAEEYIPKPFHLKELLIRVKHVLEDHVNAVSGGASPTVRCLGKTIDLAALSVRSEDGKIEYLAARDRDLLALLIERAPQVLSRDEILNAVWGEEKFPSSRTVDNAIVRLRQILGDSDGAVIRSARGIGYQWIKAD